MELDEQRTDNGRLKLSRGGPYVSLREIAETEFDCGKWMSDWLVFVHRDGLEDYHADTELSSSGPGDCHPHP